VRIVGLDPVIAQGSRRILPWGTALAWGTALVEVHDWHGDIPPRALITNDEDEISLILALLREQRNRLETRVSTFGAMQNLHPEEITQRNVAENARIRHQLDKIRAMLEEATASEEALDHEDD